MWSVVAVLAAVATGLGVYSYLSYLRAQIPVAGRLVPMLVAARDLEPGEAITAELVRLAEHPERYLPEGAMRSVEPALGRVVAVPIFAGEPILARKLGATGGISSVVPPGMRAYSLVVGSGLGFLPKPGDRVDVLVTLPREVLGEPTSLTVLRGKEVAAVAAGSRQSLGAVGERLGLPEQMQGGVGITLFVTPEEAQRLAMAESLGRITVILAPAKAEEDEGPPPVVPRDLGAR